MPEASEIASPSQRLVRYALPVMNDRNAPVVRRLTRAAALIPALLVLTAVSPALGAPPERWEDPEPVSTLYALALLAGIPLALFAVIALLVYVPSMARGESYTPGLAWRNENEWFGGPQGGVAGVGQGEREAIESPGSAQAEDSRGGASAHW